MNHPTRICLYDGPSRYNGARIRAYLYLSQGNQKTGRVAGLLIVPAGAIDIRATWQAGENVAVCGNCPHLDGTCYALNGRTPMALRQTLTAAATLEPVANVHQSVAHFLARHGIRALRSAVYGDAAALPVDTWYQIQAACTQTRTDVLGYTHGHVSGVDVSHLRRTHVLSVESAAEHEAARPLGWRTFRVAPAGTLPGPREFACPASAERGHKLTCGECLACGTRGNEFGSRSVLIWDHSPAGSSATRKHLAQLAIARAADSGMHGETAVTHA